MRVTVDGGLLCSANGSAVDADGDGQPGGVAIVDFDTLTLTTLPGTAVCGRVFASELIPGQNGTSMNVPLAGVTIHVDGAQDLLAITDQFGNFRLEPAPVGRFFVFIRASVMRAASFEDLKYASDTKASAMGIDDGFPEVEPMLIR